VRERALWRVLPYLRPHKKRLAFITGSAVVSVGAQLAVPLIAEAAIDGPIQQGNKRGLVPLLVLAVVLAIIELSLTYRRRLALSRVATSVETKLRDDFYAQLQRLDVGFHDRWQSGQLLSRANSDISLIRRFAAFGAIFLMIVVLEVIVIFALLLHLDMRLGLLTIATAVPVVILCRRFERRYHTVVRDIQDQTGDLTTMIEEAARGIRVIKAFGRSDEMFSRYDARCRQLRDTEMERVRVHTRFIWVLGLIPNLTLAAVLLGGAFAVSWGSLSVGGLVAFVSYLLILVFPVVTALGFDPIWFGIIIVMTVELGLIHPPVGMNVFVIKTAVKDISFATIFKGVLPFIATDMLRLVILITFPSIALYLPSLM